jgi:mono/diheme cytochrome c family protein
MLAQRAQQIAQLDGYGWVDKAAGVAHIPISEAIAQLAVSGLPVASAALSDTAPVSPTVSDPSPDLTHVNYVDHILPIVEQHCAECHGEDKQEEGLKLTTYRGIMNGSQNGPVVVAGEPDASYLVDMVVSGKMPKRGKHLSQSEIDTIIAWIKAGAPEKAASTPAAEAATPVDLANVSFQANVLPIFVQHCSECHGEDKQEEGLKLTSYRSVMSGSQNGTVVEPGDPASSYLVKMVTSGKMPKRGAPLSQNEIEIISAWIKAGALDN